MRNDHSHPLIIISCSQGVLCPQTGSQGRKYSQSGSGKMIFWDKDTKTLVKVNKALSPPSELAENADEGIAKKKLQTL